jgi:selenocysteine-specific elongation factor
MILRGRDRFILRTLSPPATVGGGVVLDPYPPRRRRSPRCDVGAFIEGSGLEGAMSSTLAVRSGLSPDAALHAIEQAHAVIVGDRVFPPGVISVAENAIEQAIAAEIGNHSLEGGVPLHSIRSAQRIRQEVFDFVLDRLERRKRIAVEGSRVRPFGWTSTLGESDTALRQAIMHEICIRPSEPPSVAELVAKHGARTHAMLKRLAAENELEKVSEDRYYTVGAVSEMFSALERRLERGRVYSPAELREVLGVTRKYLIPFLEFSDRKGVTERVQQGRSLRVGRAGRDAVQGESVRSGRA